MVRLRRSPRDSQSSSAAPPPSIYRARVGPSPRGPSSGDGHEEAPGRARGRESYAARQGAGANTLPPGGCWRSWLCHPRGDDEQDTGKGFCEAAN
jgi:hypothetical protein